MRTADKRKTSACPTCGHVHEPADELRTFLEGVSALSHESRVKILEWLKNPLEHFPRDHSGPAGVSLAQLKEKLGISQATTSSHMRILLRAGFVIATKKEQWTLYVRNETGIEAFKSLVIARL